MLLTLVLVTAAVFPSLILSLALGSIDRPWLPSPTLGPEAPSEPRAVVRGPRSPWLAPSEPRRTAEHDELRWVC